MRLSILAGAVGTVLLCISAADAAELYYESFTEGAYPTGYFGTAPNVGGNWSDAYILPGGNPPHTVNDQIVSNSLSTAGTLAFPSSGGKLHALGQDNSRGFSTMSAGVGADNTTIYASFLMDLSRQASGTSSGISGLELWDGAYDSTINGGSPVNRSLWAGWQGDNYRVGSNRSTDWVALEAGVTNFVVLEFDYAAGNDTINVFVNPTLDELLNGNATGTIAGGDFSFDRIGLTSFNNGGMDGFIDEIRVGTSLADVANLTAATVPEPTGVALWLLAAATTGLVFAARRQRARTAR